MSQAAPLNLTAIRPTDQVAMERRPPRCDRHPSAAALVLVESPTFAGREGATAADGPRGQLALCGHCFERNDVLLAAHGWAVVADTRPALYAGEALRRTGRAR